MAPIRHCKFDWNSKSKTRWLPWHHWTKEIQEVHWWGEKNHSDFPKIKSSKPKNVFYRPAHVQIFYHKSTPRWTKSQTLPPSFCLQVTPRVPDVSSILVPGARTLRYTHTPRHNTVRHAFRSWCPSCIWVCLYLIYLRVSRTWRTAIGPTACIRPPSPHWTAAASSETTRRTWAQRCWRRTTQERLVRDSSLIGCCAVLIISF